VQGPTAIGGEDFPQALAVGSVERLEVAKETPTEGADLAGGQDDTVLLARVERISSRWRWWTKRWSPTFTSTS